MPAGEGRRGSHRLKTLLSKADKQGAVHIFPTEIRIGILNMYILDIILFRAVFLRNQPPVTHIRSDLPPPAPSPNKSGSDSTKSNPLTLHRLNSSNKCYAHPLEILSKRVYKLPEFHSHEKHTFTDTRTHIQKALLIDSRPNSPFHSTFLEQPSK